MLTRLITFAALEGALLLAGRHQKGSLYRVLSRFLKQLIVENATSLLKVDPKLRQ